MFDKNNKNDKVIKDDNKNKVTQLPNIKNDKPYDYTDDIREILTDILDKFGDNENQMELVKGVVKSLIADGNGIRFEIPEDAEDFDPVNCENCEKKDSCDAYQRYDAITKSEGSSDVAPTSTTEERDWIRIFDDMSTDELNRAINQFEAEFDDEPYLIMSELTLKVFEEQCEGLTCEDMGSLCCQIDDCEDCPANDCGDEDMVIINHDCENGIFTACYLHHDVEYTIAIDNDLAFGVVKVR